MKKILILVCVSIVLSTTSCTSISYMLKSMGEMRKSANLVYDFFEAISKNDMSSAEEMLHPKSELCGDGLKEYLSLVEEELGISFSEHLAIQSDTTALSANPDFERGYVTKASIFFNKQPYKLSVLTVSDTNGFGIYSIIIAPYEE
ncbi:MAG: hypothetical protein J6V80_05565 [Clostridia bacterium]|nr:hypothetical protein [Clostridia bacterium]